MRICIPTRTDRGAAAETHDHFGSAPYFTIVDSEGDALQVVANPGCHDRRHSCHHLSLLRAHSVDVVACRGIGRRAGEQLRDAGIGVLVATPATAAEVVEEVRTGKARPLSVDEFCGGGHGGHGGQGGQRARHGQCHGHS